MPIPTRRLTALAKHAYQRYESMTPEQRRHYLAVGKETLDRVQRHLAERQPSTPRNPTTPRVNRPVSPPQR